MGLISQRFDATEAWWKTLPQRQRVALGFLFSWLCLFMLDQIGSALVQRLPGLNGMADILNVIRPLLLNQVVVGLIFGGILIGFWPNIVSMLWKMRGCFFVLVIFAGSLGLLGVFIYMTDVIGRMFDSGSFSPPMSVTLDESGKQRKFTHHTLSQIRDIYNHSTELGAANALHDDLGKWIAVSGKLYAITGAVEPRDSYDVQLLQYEGETILNFSNEWKDRLSKFPVKARVHALCILTGGHNNMVHLGNCRLL